jgi:outer membrane protein TolC
MIANSVQLRRFATGVLMLIASAVVFAQVASHQTGPPADESVSFAAVSSTQSSGSALPDQPAITLQDALIRAKANNAQFQTAATDALLAREDRVQARAALLPSVNYTTSYLYTEGNGTASGRFIANNGVHEYLAQGNAHEVVGLAEIADFRRSHAALALARAKAEIAARGLVVTVVESYYNVVVTERGRANAQAAADEAQHFVTISRQLERGGEVAHSDVIKAELQSNDRQHDLQEATLAEQKAKLALAVLLFPNFTQDFTVVDDLRFAPPLPPFTEVQDLAQRNNVDLKAAAAALQVANHEVTVARAGHLPSLTLDYWYGIDANHFAVRTDGFRNLGYAAQATLLLPVFNWGAIQSKVKQADLRRRLARVELTQAQREAIANLNAFYAESSTARSELDLLRNSANLAAESLRLTDVRYQAGEATALEVVDAQNSLVLARNAYDAGEARYRIAIARLQTLTGSF